MDLTVQFESGKGTYLSIHTYPCSSAVGILVDSFSISTVWRSSQYWKETMLGI